MPTLVKLLKVLAGLAVGCALAELAFRARSQGAFPHINFYEPDHALGVRLAPNARLRLAFSGNPATEVHTNDLGFRGAAWPTAGAREVLVVGDSQVFGLGVDDSQTFAAQLEAKLGGTARVLNAGVPTYGPLEYTALVERWVAARKPAQVVYVLNLANDLFELERPNRERHAVWDGWAVRKETAPLHVVEFPLRRWLMAQSHAIFALRSALRGLSADDAQFASEGTWQELAALAHGDVLLPERDVRTAIETRSRLGQALRTHADRLITAFARQASSDPRFKAAFHSLGRTAGDPRDIVQSANTESGRPVPSTAFQLLFAALALDKNTAQLEALAKTAGADTLLSILAERRALRAQVAANVEHAGDLRPPNTLDAVLARTRRACDAVQAQLLLAILPLDVQVSAEEWKKYGHAALDLGPTRALITDLEQRAARLGIHSLDLTPALRATEPGAFLHGDLHMSPKGHASVAQALVEALRAPPPPSTALPLAPGRSLLPTGDEWAATDVEAAPVANAFGCQLKHVREWWHLQCLNAIESGADAVHGLVAVRGGHGDVFAELERPLPRSSSYRVLPRTRTWNAQLVAPVLDGDVLEVRVGFQQHSRSLRIEQRAAAAQISWGPSEAALATEGVAPNYVRAVISELDSPYDQRCLSALQEQLTTAQRRMAADDATAAADIRAIFDRWPSCELGRRQTCGEHEVDFGVLGRCVAACAPTKPCARGRCEADRGRFGCIEP